MVVIERHSTGLHNSIQINSIDSTLMFDCYSPIYGKNFTMSSFEKPAKSLEFIMKDFKNLDSVFISSSLSFGCFFLKNTKIYITRPVYEQLIIKYNELMNLSVSYDTLTVEEALNYYFSNSGNHSLDSVFHTHFNDDSVSCNDNVSYKIFSITEIDLEKFKRSVVFVKYNQVIKLNSIDVIAQPSGSYIGWCNYKIHFSNSKSLLILSSYSKKRRFSIEASDIISDYLIINRLKIPNNHEIKEFSSFINDYIESQTNKNIIIPLDLSYSFIEVLFHILYLVENSSLPITVISPSFKQLDLMLNIQSEWLNKDFFSISEPFPIRKYSNLKNLADFASFNEVKNIVFCDFLYYRILKDRNFFKKNEILLLNFYEDEFLKKTTKQNDVFLEMPKRLKVEEDSDFLPGITEAKEGSLQYFDLRIETPDEEILKEYSGKCLNSQFIGNILTLETESTYEIVYLDPMTEILNKSIVLNGKLTISDKNTKGKIRINLENENTAISNLLKNDKLVFIDGCYYLFNSKVKLKFKNEDQIRYCNID